MNKPKNKQTTNQLIAREGYKPIAIFVILMLVFVFVKMDFLAVIALLIIIFFLIIFRNTERIQESRDKNAIIAPCDGVIKEISLDDTKTTLLIKVNIFNNGIFRVPISSTKVESIFKFGLFIKDNNILKDILNTKHIINGFNNNVNIFTITLFPELWNKVSIYEIESAFAGDRLGFMKYGYFLLTINGKTKMKVARGDSIIAGESLLGRLL